MKQLNFPVENKLKNPKNKTKEKLKNLNINSNSEVVLIEKFHDKTSKEYNSSFIDDSNYIYSHKLNKTIGNSHINNVNLDSYKNYQKFDILENNSTIDFGKDSNWNNESFHSNSTYVKIAKFEKDKKSRNDSLGIYNNNSSRSYNICKIKNINDSSTSSSYSRAFNIKKAVDILNKKSKLEGRHSIGNCNKNINKINTNLEKNNFTTLGADESYNSQDSSFANKTHSNKNKKLNNINYNARKPINPEHSASNYIMNKNSTSNNETDINSYNNNLEEKEKESIDIVESEQTGREVHNSENLNKNFLFAKESSLPESLANQINSFLMKFGNSYNNIEIPLFNFDLSKTLPKDLFNDINSNNLNYDYLKSLGYPDSNIVDSESIYNRYSNDKSQIISNEDLRSNVIQLQTDQGLLNDNSLLSKDDKDFYTKMISENLNINKNNNLTNLTEANFNNMLIDSNSINLNENFLNGGLLNASTNLLDQAALSDIPLPLANKEFNLNGVKLTKKDISYNLSSTNASQSVVEKTKQKQNKNKGNTSTSKNLNESFDVFINDGPSSKSKSTAQKEKINKYSYASKSGINSPDLESNINSNFSIKNISIPDIMPEAKAKAKANTSGLNLLPRNMTQHSDFEHEKIYNAEKNISYSNLLNDSSRKQAVLQGNMTKGNIQEEDIKNKNKTYNLKINKKGYNQSTLVALHHDSEHFNKYQQDLKKLKNIQKQSNLTSTKKDKEALFDKIQLAKENKFKNFNKTLKIKTERKDIHEPKSFRTMINQESTKFSSYKIFYQIFFALYNY